LDGKEKIRPDCEEAEKGDDAAHHGHTQREAIGEGYRPSQPQTAVTVMRMQLVLFNGEIGKLALNANHHWKRRKPANILWL
jgi:hypothetical protein